MLAPYKDEDVQTLKCIRSYSNIEDMDFSSLLYGGSQEKRSQHTHKANLECCAMSGSPLAIGPIVSSPMESSR